MWARVVEFVLGCWLAISPFIFAHADDQIGLWATDWICATLVIALALLSYWHSTRHAHVLTLLVATGLIAIGRFSTDAPSPAMQNQIVVGLLLLMFALVPNEASRPPASWQNRQDQPTLSQ